MSNNINLNDLWMKQTANPPQTEEFFLNITKIKKKGILKLIAFNILMIATIAFIVYIWIYYKPQLITTKIGIVIIILSILFYLLIYNLLIPHINKINENQSNDEFLKAIIKLKEKQKLLQSKLLQIYYVFFTLGICLYSYEYLSQLSFFWGVFGYFITLIWIGFNWFYLRPKRIQKEQNKLNAIITKFEEISRQH